MDKCNKREIIKRLKIERELNRNAEEDDCCPGINKHPANKTTHPPSGDGLRLRIKTYYCAQRKAIIIMMRKGNEERTHRRRPNNGKRKL